MANWVAFRSAIRASRATLTASRALRRSTAAGLSAADLAWAARSNWAFFASAAVFRRSAKTGVLVPFHLNLNPLKDSRYRARAEDFRSALAPADSRAWIETKLEKLAHDMSGL